MEASYFICQHGDAPPSGAILLIVAALLITIALLAGPMRSLTMPTHNIALLLPPLAVEVAWLLL